MTKIKITEAVAAEIAAVREAGKTPWVVIGKDPVLLVHVASGRAEARAAAEGRNIAIRVVKADDVEFEVIAPVKSEPAPAPKADKEIVRKSTVSGPCRMVWDIAERMEGQRRKDIIAACVAAGVAYYTARTQYQMWLTIRNEERAREAAQAAKKA